MKNTNGKKRQHYVNEVNADAHNVGPLGVRLLTDKVWKGKIIKDETENATTIYN